MTTSDDFLINAYAKEYAVNWFKMNEGSGNTLNDSKGNALGVITGATWISGGGLSFNGVDNFVQFNNKLPKGAKSIYIDFAITSNKVNFILTNINSGLPDGFFIQYTNSGFLRVSMVKNNTYLFDNNNIHQLELNKRYKLLVTWDGTVDINSLKIVIWEGVNKFNYSFTPTSTETVTPYSENTFIGTRAQKDIFLGGNIYNLIVWNQDVLNLFGTLNKTLILQNGEYKKFEGYVPEIPSSYLNIVPKMTSNTAPSGVAKASTVFGTREAWNAFDGNALTYWESSGTTNVDWLSYTFQEPKKIEAYAILSGVAVLAETPLSWTFQGSNDESTWVTLDTKTNQPSWGVNERRLYEVTNSNYYKTYRITITNPSTFTSMKAMELLEYIPPIKGITPSWQTVSTTLPTVNQFVEEGMNSLTPLFDRAVQNLNPQEMTLDSTFVGEGKLFRKSIDLNKYFDLRTITTETRNS